MIDLRLLGSTYNPDSAGALERGIKLSEMNMQHAAKLRYDNIIKAKRKLAEQRAEEQRLTAQNMGQMPLNTPMPSMQSLANMPINKDLQYNALADLNDRYLAGLPVNPISAGGDVSNLQIKDLDTKIKQERLHQIELSNARERNTAPLQWGATKETLPIIKSFSSDYRKYSAPVLSGINSANKVLEIIGNNPDGITGADQIALVFSFMKSLDPGSVVRESEFKLPEAASGVWNKLTNVFSKYKEGKFLPKSAVEDIRNTTIKLMNYYKEGMRKGNNYYLQNSLRSGIAPDLVVSYNDDGYASKPFTYNERLAISKNGNSRDAGLWQKWLRGTNTPNAKPFSIGAKNKIPKSVQNAARGL